MSFEDVTVGQIIVYVIISLLCGLLGQLLVARSKSGFLVAAVVGLGGALLGAYAARHFSTPEPMGVSVDGEAIPVIGAVIGGALVTLAYAGVQRARARRRAG